MALQRLTLRDGLLAALLLAIAAAACQTETPANDHPSSDADAGADAADLGDATGDAAAAPFTPPHDWTVSLSSDAPEAVGWAAADLADYLTRMGLAAEVDTASTAVPACQPGQGHAVLLGDGLGTGELADDATDQTFRIHEERCPPDGVLVRLSGGGLLGRQYAVYEWLHTLGVRFFHPEQEYVPAAPRWPDTPVDRQLTPAFRYRSVSLHLVHPLELGDAFVLGLPQYQDEAVRYIDWQIKNLASFGTEGVGSGDMADYGVRRGFPRSTGFSLHDQQQGSQAVIDPDDPRSEEEQMAAAIDARMGDPATAPQFFSFSFDPSEFTEIDDQQAVREMTFIAHYIDQHYPGTHLQTIDHGTHGEPTAYYGVRFYDLPEFAPDNLGVEVHPLMFFDLFRPAPVYGNTDFHFLYDFMVHEYRHRPLWYFPESAWWLTFDIAVPLYLPITLDARDRDIQGIAFMLDGQLEGHRVFGSGQEWGYWQNEYCPFRMAADLSYRWTDCLADIVSPMGDAGPEVESVIEAVAAYEERDIIYGDLLRYLVGTDPETEVAASVGVVFHPLPPSPQEILRWDLDQVESWQDRIAPTLERMDADYAALVARLDAVEPLVPEDGLPWLDEVRDGIEVTGLRARHALQVYGAVVTYRQSQLRFDASLADQAAALLDQARATTQAALDVIHRREASYRYHPLDRSIAGGPDGTQDDNWTIYHYRYLNRTHWAYYYTRIDDLVAAALAGGGGDQVEVSDALLAPDEALVVSAADAALGQLTVDFGEGDPQTGTSVSHTYSAPGLYDLSVTAGTDAAPFALNGRVAALETQYQTGFSGQVVEPAGADLIENVFPGLVFGQAGQGRLALGFSADPSGRVGLDGWTPLDEAEPPAGDLFQSRPAQLVVPVVNRANGDVLTSVVVEDAQLALPLDATTADLSGELSTQAVIDAIVAIGGFDADGARRIVASTLGYTPDTLPERVPFHIEYTLQ